MWRIWTTLPQVYAVANRCAKREITVSDVDGDPGWYRVRSEGAPPTLSTWASSFTLSLVGKLDKS